MDHTNADTGDYGFKVHFDSKFGGFCCKATCGDNKIVRVSTSTDHNVNQLSAAVRERERERERERKREKEREKRERRCTSIPILCKFAKPLIFTKLDYSGPRIGTSTIT